MQADVAFTGSDYDDKSLYNTVLQMHAMTEHPPPASSLRGSKRKARNLYSIVDRELNC